MKYCRFFAAVDESRILPLHAKCINSALSGLHHRETAGKRHRTGNDGALVCGGSGNNGAVIIPDDVDIPLGIPHYYARILNKRRRQSESVEQILRPDAASILFIVSQYRASILAYVKVIFIHGQAGV